MTTAKATTTTLPAKPRMSVTTRMRIQLRFFFELPARTRAPVAGAMLGLKNIPSATDSSPLAGTGAGVGPGATAVAGAIGIAITGAAAIGDAAFAGAGTGVASATLVLDIAGAWIGGAIGGFGWASGFAGTGAAGLVATGFAAGAVAGFAGAAPRPCMRKPHFGH